MSTERVALAVLGLGDIARKAHLPVLAARSDVDIMALVSRSGRGAAGLAAQYRFPIQATTLDEVIDCHPAHELRNEVVRGSKSVNHKIQWVWRASGDKVLHKCPDPLDLGSKREEIKGINPSFT